MEQTIESKVASAILERPVAAIEIEGVEYKIAPPSIATLILVSEVVSTLPIVRETEKEDMVASVLHHAKDYRALGDLLAILILGAKGLSETITRTIQESRLYGLVKRDRIETVVIDRKSELSKLILENVKPSVMLKLIVKRLRDLEVGDFFGITTSLSEANILKATKEVVD